MTEKRKRGRPSKYTKALGTRICKRIAEAETLRSISADPDMPDKSTILMWVIDGEHKEFSDQYMRARESAGYVHADSIVSLVPEIHSGDLPPDAARAMLQGLIWAAERMAPKTHSPKLMQEVSGPGGKPIQTITRRVIDDG